MALGTFEIYFDGDAIFDRICVAEILKDALEDAMKHVLKLRGSSLSLPFLYLGSDERNISAVYDTSAQLQQLVVLIEHCFRDSVAVRALIDRGHISAIENKSGTDLPVVCVAELTAGVRANLDNGFVSCTIIYDNKVIQSSSSDAMEVTSFIKDLVFIDEQPEMIFWVFVDTKFAI